MTKQAHIPEHAINDLPALEQADVRFVERFRPILQSPAARRLGKLGKVGDDTILLAVSMGVTAAGTLSRNPRLQRTGIRMLVSQLAARAAKEWGRQKVDRTRPAEQLDKGQYTAEPGSSDAESRSSFPSGHTASALAIARAFSREYPRYTKPVLMAATAVGVLQVPRRRNYPGDVVAGAFTGVVAEKAANIVISVIERRKRRAERRAERRARRKARAAA